MLEALRQFAAGLPTAAGLDVDPADAATELIALGKAAAVFDGVIAAAMTRYDRLAAGSPAAILVQHAGFTRTAADNLRKLGRKLNTDLPATRAGLASGDISTAHARTIVDLDDELATADEPVPQAARRQVEAAMAEYATAATTTEVTRAARDARYRLTPEPVEREMRDQRDARGITLAKTWAGLTHISGLADPVTAATITTYLNSHAGRQGPEDARPPAARRLDALADALTLAQRITTTPDDAPTAPALPESRKAPSTADASAQPDQSDADGPARSQTLALQDSCNAPRPGARPVRARPAPAVTGEDPRADGRDPFLGGDAPGDGKPGAGTRKGLAWRKTSPAHMLIIAGHDLLTGVPGAAPARLCDGTMIPADTARRVACEAALTRVVLDAEAEPLELGRTTRLFSTAQVRALIARDQGCRWTGCDTPPVTCTPHHVTWWTNGGGTDVTNGALLCPVHHRMVHEDRWQLTRDPDNPGTLIIEAPAHWPLRPPPLHSPPLHSHQPHLPTAA